RDLDLIGSVLEIGDDRVAVGIVGDELVPERANELYRAFGGAAVTQLVSAAGQSGRADPVSGATNHAWNLVYRLEAPCESEPPTQYNAVCGWHRQTILRSE